MSGALAGRRFVLTGVATKGSIAWAVAARLQDAGAEVLLTSFGRVARLTARAAARLPVPPGEGELLDWDASAEGAGVALRAQVAERWERLDGVLHAVAYAPPDALGGEFLDTPAASAEAAFRISAFSLKDLATGLAPLMPEGGSVVGLTFDGTRAWPVYDWMGVAKAALEATARYCARDLGSQGVRVNLVAAGPLATLAAGGIPGFGALAERWRDGAPLGWDTEDPGPVAEAVCFLLSPAARGITGEILHVDGGFHALGAPGA